MFSLFEGASLKIAKNLIKVTGVQQTLAVIQAKNLAAVGAPELLEQILALNACNLFQTLKEDFVERQIDAEDRQDIVDDYIVENLRLQTVIPYRDGGHLMDLCLKVQDLSEKYKVHWMEEQEESGGPGPRYYCVKDLLRRLGNEKNYELHDTLFEFVYLQHKHFIHYFKTLLEPIDAMEPRTPEGPAGEAAPGEPGGTA
ncbi:MAG TPA: hypothetical protein VHE12_10145 [bacterium]|nr:hypothetical protein [bacterium]